MAIEPVPCDPGDGTPADRADQRHVSWLTLCDDNGPFLRQLVVDGNGDTVSETDYALDAVTPYTPVGTTGVCTPDGNTPCLSPTTPLATSGLCLADGSPITVVHTRDCDGTVTQDGWINLTTGAFSAGSPPAGAVACGDARSIQVSGTFCDLDADQNVLALVLIEYEYAPDGSIASVRLVDAATGATYTLQGTLSVCPTGSTQPEQDLVVLCDDDGAGTVIPFLRDFRRDENGVIAGHSDYDLDGDPFTPAGTVTVCGDLEEESPGEPPDQVDVELLCYGTPAAGGTTPFLRHIHTAWDGTVTTVDTTLAGTPLTIPPGNIVGRCIDIDTETWGPLCVLDADGDVVRHVIATRRYRTDLGGALPGVTFSNPVTGNADSLGPGETYAVCPDQEDESPPEPCHDCEPVVLCDTPQITTDDVDFQLALSGTSPHQIQNHFPADRYDTPVDASPFFSAEFIADQHLNVPASAPGTVQTFRVFAGRVNAECDIFSLDCGREVQVTVQVEMTVTNNGPDPIPDVSRYGRAVGFDGIRRSATRDLLGPIAVGESQTTGSVLIGPVPYADLLAGRATVEVALQTAGDDGTTQSWTITAPSITLIDVQGDFTGCGHQFLRTVCRDCDGQPLAAPVDTELDGATPYTPVGAVSQCAPHDLCDGPGPDVEPCRQCETLQLCDLTEESAILPLGATSGTLPNGVTWSTDAAPGTVDGDPNGWWAVQTPDGAPRSFEFDRAVRLQFQVVTTGPCITLPAGAQPVTLDPSHTWDPATRHLCQSATPNIDARSTFEIAGPGASAVFSAQEAASAVALVGVVEVAVEVTTPFLRTVCRDCSGAFLARTDTTLDGETAYVVQGEVTVCAVTTPADGGGEEPCRVASTFEVCVCDDVNGDGTDIVTYTEVWAIGCDGGAPTMVYAYQSDPSVPYEPTNRVDCGTFAAPTEQIIGVRSQRIQLAPGETWDAATVPLLQSVTVVAATGQGQVTTQAGTSTLFQGEHATWSVVHDRDLTLHGPLTIAATTGIVTVTYTEAVTA